MLIENKADIHATDDDKQHVLFWAIRCNASTAQVISMIKYFIQAGVDPNSVDEWGQTFAHLATINTSPETFHEIVSYLDSINNTKSFTIETDETGAQVLHLAVQFLQDVMNDTLKIFKSNGVNFNAKDNYGRNALDIAVARVRNDTSFLENLIAFGADYGEKIDSWDTTLHWAAFNGNLPAVELFISLGENINMVDIDGGKSPLEYALHGGQNATFVNSLIGLGAEWKIINRVNQESALHHA